MKINDLQFTHVFIGKLLNHQHLVEFSTTNDGKNEKSSYARESNDEDCDDEDGNDENGDDGGDGDDSDEDESNNMVLMEKQINNLVRNEPINKSGTITTSHVNIQGASISSDTVEQMNVKYTDEQQIKRLRKRKRRRRRRRRRRKSTSNQITFAVDKDAPLNINAEQVRPQSLSSDANETPHTTSNSFASQKHNSNMGLRVRRAILWIKVDAIDRNGQYKEWTTARRLNHSANTKKQFTLWVFHMVEPYCKSKSKPRRVMCCFGVPFSFFG